MFAHPGISLYNVGGRGLSTKYRDLGSEQGRQHHRKCHIHEIPRKEWRRTEKRLIENLREFLHIEPRRKGETKNSSLLASTVGLEKLAPRKLLAFFEKVGETARNII